MDIHPATPRDNRGYGTGLRTAMVVIVLGTLAAVADHAFFIAPHGVTSAVAADTPPPATLAVDAGLPPDLHPTAADVTPAAPTF